MYVCICNALTESRVREAASKAGRSVTSVYECFGVTPRCGKCAANLRDLLRQASPSPEAAAE